MISWLNNRNCKTPSGSISIEELYELLLNPGKHPFNKSVRIIKQLLATTDTEEKNRLKLLLPVIVPGALVSTRSAEALDRIIQYSGFMQIDIDKKDNKNLPPVAIARDWLANNIPYVALSAISASQQSVWCLVALQEPEKFISYSEAISEYFRKAGITIDITKSKNPMELRFFSPDPGAILCHDYKLFPTPVPAPLSLSYHKQQPLVLHKLNHKGNSVEAECQQWVEHQIGYSLVDGQKHNYLFWLSYALYTNGLSKDSIEIYIYSLIPQNQIKSNCIIGGIKHAKHKGSAF